MEGSATQYIGNFDKHIGVITDELTGSGIDRSDIAMLDHLCYRVETNARYIETKRVLGEIALLKGEAEVQGRQIAIFELNDYIRSHGWVVPYIELPAPKNGSPYPEGLEHAEFVVVGSLERFQEKYSGLPFDTKAMNRHINPELGLKTKKASMKFHKLQIGTVIDIEAQM
jgi:predicted metalloenzyme YecM